MTEKEILEVEKKLGYTFRDRSLLVQAFTRTSYVNEKKRKEQQSNQVLEFFGDSVLSCALVTLLIRDFSKRYAYGVTSRFDEGDFSVMKSHLSDKTKLSEVTAKLGFGPYLLMGEGDRKLGIDEEPSVLEDLYESIIGAIWIDSECNIEVVTRVVENTLDFHAFALDMIKPMQNPKNQLQEYCQDKKHRLPNPEYTMIDRRGEEHNPTYLVECRVGDLVAIGEGRNIQKASIAAAERMLSLLKEREGKVHEAASITPRHPADTPVSQLQRIANQRKIPLSFTDPKQREVNGIAIGDFYTTCVFGGKSTEGQGKSKSESKQQSALKMLEMLEF